MVRRKYTRQLSKNLNKILREHDSLMQIKREWDVIEVDSSLLKLNEIAKFDGRLRCIPGVGRIHKVRKYPIPPMEDMFHLARDKKVFPIFMWLLKNFLDWAVFL